MNNSQSPMPDVPKAEKSNPSLDHTNEETKGVPVSEIVTFDLGFDPPIEPNEVGVLGPYRIVSELGRGGMGAVYAAIDTRLDRKLALKVMLPQYAANSSAKERFLREARAVAKVKHINVVTIYEADERKGIPYIAMEFLEGYPLDQYLKRKGSPSLKQIVRIASETLSGLGAAHKLGLIHRDIKPGNLWLESPNGLVKVLDFGLAKPIDSEVELTKSGAIVGTPAYMSTEQAEGAKLDARADLYSVGVLMYRLCSGRLPFEGPNTIAVLMAIANKEPLPVRELNPSVPESLAQLIHQLLAKSADQRPQSAGEVIIRLKAIAHELDGRNPVPITGSGPHTVPLAVTAIPDANPFENIDVDSVTQIVNGGLPDQPKEVKPKPVAKKKKPLGLWIAAGCSLLLLAILGGVILFLTQNKDNPQAKGNPSDPPVNKPPENELPPKKVPAEDNGPALNDPDRKAAEWILKAGGVAMVQSGERPEDTCQALSDLPKEPFVLTRIIMTSTQRINNDDLKVMHGCKNIRWIQFNSSNINDEGIAHFQHCKDIEELILFQTEITEKGFEIFKDFTNLKHLNLVGQKITDRCLENFKNAKKLTRLDIRESKITDNGLTFFQGCNGLKELMLQDCKELTDKGLEIFKDAQLEELTLHSFPFTDKGLAYFKNIKNLRILSLSKGNIADNSLGHFRQCQNLRMLSISDLNISDEGLSFFKDCTSLTNLNLVQTKITNKVLIHFTKCAELHNINLYGTNVTDDIFVELKGYQKLGELYVAKTKVTFKAAQEFQKSRPQCRIHHDEGDLPPIEVMDPDRKAAEWAINVGATIRIKGREGVFDKSRQLPNEPFVLTELWMSSNVKINNEDLRIMQGCNHLRVINLSSTKVNDIGISNFKHCKDLDTLMIFQTDVTEKGFETFKEMEKLTYLSLAGQRVTDQALKNFQKAKMLTRIDIRGAEITDEGLSYFQGCINLKELMLIQCKRLTDRGLENFKGVTLEKLSLQGIPITDIGLTNFKNHQELDSLVLMFVDVTDKGLENFKGCKKLHQLNLQKTNVTDKGLSNFKDCVRINYLNLGNTKITNKALGYFKNSLELSTLHLNDNSLNDDIFEQLKHFKNLTELDVQKTPITFKAAQEFQKSLPKCRIDHSEGQLQPKK